MPSRRGCNRLFAWLIVPIFAWLIACVATVRVASASDMAAPLWSNVHSSVAVDGRWQPLIDRERLAHSAVYDARRREMIVFGGLPAAASEGPERLFDGAPFGDVLIYSPEGDPAWRTLTTSGPAPEPRAEHTALLDPDHDQMIVFGGRAADGRYLNDVWALSLSEPRTWTQLTPSGDGPAPRAGHSVVLDTRRGRMIVYGGTNQVQAWGDCWALELSGTPTWTRLPGFPMGDSPRAHASLVYDPVRDRVILLGGLYVPAPFSLARNLLSRGPFYMGFESTPFGYFNDVWQLSLASDEPWSPLLQFHLPFRAAHAVGAFFDPDQDAIVMLAGADSLGVPGVHLATHSLSGAAYWNISRVVQPVEPVTGVLGSFAVDPIGRRLFWFGGVSGRGPQPPEVATLTWSGTPHWHWSEHTPRIRDLEGVVAPRGDVLLQLPRTVVAAGDDYTDFSAVRLAAMPQRERVHVGGTPPPAREFPAVVSDESGDRLLFFGGHEGAGPLRDLWELANVSGKPEWRLLEAVGAPALRWPQAFVVPSRSVLVVLGEGERPWELWEYPLHGGTGWSRWPTEGPGFGEAGGQIVYDSTRERLIAIPASDTSRGVLVCDLGGDRTWHHVAVGGFIPRLTWTLDASRDRLVAFGGAPEPGSLARQSQVLHAMSLVQPMSVQALAPQGSMPRARGTAAWVYDAGHDRFLMFGGFHSTGTSEDLWALSFTDEITGAPPSTPSRPEYLLASPVPAGPSGTTLRWVASRSGPVRVTVHDAAGRRIRTLVEGTRPAGSDVAQWDVRDDGGRALSAGVYFARLETPAGTSTRRIVVVR